MFVVAKKLWGGNMTDDKNVTDGKKTVEKVAALKEGWETYKSNFWFITGVFIFIFLATMAMQYMLFRPFENLFAEMAMQGPQSFKQIFSKIYLQMILLYIVLILFTMFLQIGPIKIILKLIDGEKPFFSDLTAYSHLFIKYVVSSILFILMMIGVGALAMICVAVLSAISGAMQMASPQAASIGKLIFALGGFFFMFVPYTYYAIKYGFYGFIVVDKELGPIKALKESARITDGAKLQIVLFFLLIIAMYAPFVITMYAIMFNNYNSMMSAMVSGATSPFAYLLYSFQLFFAFMGVIVYISYLKVYRMIDKQSNPEEIKDDTKPIEDEPSPQEELPFALEGE